VKSVIGLSAVFLTRGAGALGGAVLSLLVARLAGANGLGQFTVFISLLGIFSMLAKRGMDTILIRVIARAVHRDHTDRIIPLLAYSAKVCLMAAVLLSIPGVILLESDLLGDTSANSSLVFIFCFPIFTVMAIIAGYLKGIGKPWLAPLCEIGGISLGASLLLIALLVIGHQSSLETIVTILLLSVIIMFLVSVLIVMKDSSLQKNSLYALTVTDEERLELRKGQASFTINAFSGYLIQAGSFVIAAFFLTEDVIGQLRAAERIAVLVSFPVLAINPFIASRIVRYIESGCHGSLWKLMGKASFAGTGIVFPVLFVIMIAPEFILAFFGQEFIQATDYLRILALVHFVLVILGPFSMLMSMAGGERQLMSVSIVTLSAAITIYPILTHSYGVEGFIFAYALISVARAAMIAYFGKNKIQEVFRIKKQDT